MPPFSSALRRWPACLDLTKTHKRNCANRENTSFPCRCIQYRTWKHVVWEAGAKQEKGCIEILKRDQFMSIFQCMTDSNYLYNGFFSNPDGLYLTCSPYAGGSRFVPVETEGLCSCLIFSFRLSCVR